ncbi:hypothetical protein R69749_06277 [Paraburkholderia domus]|jgi:hypothetical protein|uniref:Uncharacterized protein n=1 Tax=Paraburkholderia domus TaxID=2793075 RepID=A0A9N8QYS7_9BURK|nr:hypothetical protein R75483_01973 [Paraburkholderia domus]CAE6871891.1 hypothetical protein R69749_06277 [Paraburkholderia domus]CAE6882988.1 hypothetical protein R70211_02238 [Paraburkholderia domus]
MDHLPFLSITVQPDSERLYLFAREMPKAMRDC